LRRILIEKFQLLRQDIHSDYKIISVNNNLFTFINYHPVENVCYLYINFYYKNGYVVNLVNVFNDIYLSNNNLLESFACGRRAYKIKLTKYLIYDYESFLKIYKKNNNELILECERISDIIFNFFSKNNYIEYIYELPF
jgi:hypothetical protein